MNLQDSLNKLRSKIGSTGSYWSIKITTNEPSYSQIKCPKCGQQKIASNYVKVDDTRDCLLVTCHECGFEDTRRTADNKGSFDLPTVEEAKKVGA